MIQTVITAAEQAEAVLRAGEGFAEIVEESGNHGKNTFALADLGPRSDGAKLDRGVRWRRRKPAVRAALYGRRRRIRSARGGTSAPARRAIALSAW